MNKALVKMTCHGSIISANNTNGCQSKVSVGLLISALAVQLGLLWFAMPMSELGSGNWFFHIDNPFHIYQLELGRALLTDGRLVGYDPFFGAGHLAGLSSNVSARFSLIFAALLPTTMQIPTVYAVYVLVCSLVAPLSLWALGQQLNWEYWQRVYAIVIGLLLWWVGVFHWYHTAGMVSFVCACYIAPVYAVWIYSLCHSNTPLRPVPIVSSGLLGGVCMWLHPLFCIPVVSLCLCLLFLDELRPRLIPLLIRATALACVVVLVSLPWVTVLLANAGQASNEHGYQRAVGLSFLVNSMGFGSGGALGATINLVLFGICAIGILMRFGEKRTTVNVFFIVGLGLLLFASFAGINSTLAYVQPNRFLGPAYLFIGIAASFHITKLISWVGAGPRNPSRMGISIVGVLIVLFFVREVGREITPGSHQHHGKAPYEISAPPVEVAQLVSWIEANTNTNARILLEASLGRVHGGGHIAGYLASQTKREFMGAAYPYFLPQLSCWDKSCFNRPISKMSAEFFGTAIQTYNVGWIVAHSDELKDFLTQMQGIKLVKSLGRVSIYEATGPHTFIQSGAARVVGRNFNRVEFSDAVGPILTLRYTWVKGLETVPASTIEAYQWSPDFPPLVRIVNPPASFILRLAK